MGDRRATLFLVASDTEGAGVLWEDGIGRGILGVGSAWWCCCAGLRGSVGFRLVGGDRSRR